MWGVIFEILFFVMCRFPLEILFFQLAFVIFAESVFVSCFLQEGSFSGASGAMAYSKVVTYNVSSDGLYGWAKLSLDEYELRSFAGMRSGSIATEYTVELFVGLAR